MLKSKTIGLLDGTEATRIYAPRKRTIAFLSENKLDHLGVRMDNQIDREGNTVRWEDAVTPYADILYLPFPWIIFHRVFEEGMNSNLWVAFAKRHPQKGDLVFCPPLPNMDPYQIAQRCNAETLAAQIELFWSSYFMLDEHPYGTRYGQLIFGGTNSGGFYYERWLKLEPEEVCRELRPMPDYPGVPVEDFLIGNMRRQLGDYYACLADSYTLLLGDEDGS